MLTAFEAIDKTRSVTASAKLLGLSQPAMSHILARLRLAFDDQLFVKTPKQMVPTPRATALAPVVSKILAQIEGELLQVETFTPKKLVRTFHIKTTDFVEALLLPQLLVSLADEAPGVQVSITSPDFSLPREKLEHGTCDLAIAGFFGDLPDGFYQQKLFEDEFGCAVRKAHPRLGKLKNITVDDYCAERHVLIAPGGELRGRIDQVLGKRHYRFVVGGFSGYLASGWILSGTDTVLTAPLRLLHLLGEKFALNILPVPVKVPNITIVQAWHEQNHKDPGHQWFRGVIKEILQKV